MTIMTTKNIANMTNMTNEDFDYDYNYDIDYDSEDDRPRIELYRKQPRAPVPVNIPSMKKEKENQEKLRKEKENEDNRKKKVDTFRNTAHTGIWGLPGWMVPDLEVAHVMEAKQKLQDDLASGAVVFETKELETPKIEKKENLRDVAFEVLSDKEKMKTAFEKTELCRSVTQGGECPHGENCRFLHDVALWKPRKCRFEDTCKCVKFISKPNGTFYIVNNTSGSGNKVCKFIHGGESRDNFHARTKIPKPQVATPVAIQTLPTKKTFVSVSVDDGKNTLKGKLNWLGTTITTPISVPSVPMAPFNWSQVKQQLKAEGISIVTPTPVVVDTANDEWITPKTKAHKRQEKAPVVPPSTRIGYIHQHTSLCRSVIQGIQCTHSVCRYAHDVEKIVLRKCGFEGCRNVTCVGDGVYRNTGRNVCNYLHNGETRDSYYKRLDIYKFKK